MKKRFSILIASVALYLALSAHSKAAIRLFDLKADWSNTENPNGTWSYRVFDGSLLIKNPFPWVNVDYSGVSDSITQTTQFAVVPGCLELGDIAVATYYGVAVRWTAPATGTIDISGAMWSATTDLGLFIEWTLTKNGNLLTYEATGGLPRNAPYELSFGSAGANALLNISVNAGDVIELRLLGGGGVIGLDFAIALTTEAIDPIGAIGGLAISVFEMNLQNGIENSLDSKLDAALNALNDANVNNDGAACNSLAAFISAVEAQRNKKITSAQADQLIAAAQEIKTSLNCAN